MGFSIIVSHTKDFVYLYHCLDVLEFMGFKKESIWVDGYKCICKDLEGKVKRVTTHTDGHGSRTYTLLDESTSDYVIILDSDFFCCDKRFWDEVINSLERYWIVSIGRPWNFFSEKLIMLTTPFVAYDRRAVLKAVPVREVWNHFGIIYPSLPDPIFDHLMFVFFVCQKKNKNCCVDYWEKREKYSFCHLWDSRHTWEMNIKQFEDLSINEDIRYTYLSYGLSKYVFQYVSGLISKFDPKMWEYMSNLEQHRSFLNLINTMKYLGPNICFKPEWNLRFNPIKDKFREMFKKKNEGEVVFFY